jgi:hypothetical protein
MQTKMMNALIEARRKELSATVRAMEVNRSHFMNGNVHVE